MTLDIIDHSFSELVKVFTADGSIKELNSKQVDQLIQHGFASLLSATLTHSNLGQELLSTAELERLKKIALISEATAVLRLEALSEILELAASRNILILLIKGFALAHQLYPSPGARPSSDIDVFIDADQISEVAAIFAELGYEVDAPAEISMISFQFSASKECKTGHTIIFDIHYRINNQAEYAAMFEFSSVFDRAVNLPEVSRHAKTLCLAQAYAYACVHLHGHYLIGDPVRGVWLYDIHLMLNAMTEQDQSQAVEIICSDSIGPVCKYWTNIVANNFTTRLPDKLHRSLCALPDHLVKSALKVNPVKLLWDQMVYLPTNKARLTYLKQLFIPSKQLIKAKYPKSKAWLPILYVRRAVSGFWFRLVKIGK